MIDRIRRLVAIEAIEAIEATRIEVDEPLPDVDLEFLAWLDRPSLLTTLEAFALHLARRRFAHERGCIWSAWFSHVSEDDKIRLADREFNAFTSIWLACDDLHEAIREWLAEPDAAGWPTLGSQRTDYDAFLTRLAGHRDMLRVHRDWPGGLADLWRRRHPEWRADLLPDDYDRWELGLLAHSPEVGRSP